MKFLTAAIALATLLPTAAMADQFTLDFGGDSYVAGQTTAIGQPVSREAFAAGYNVSLGSPVSGSAHMAGFNVNANAPVGGDLYAAGFSVNVTGTVARDVTAMGNSVVINSGGPIGGNARVAAANVVVDSPIKGSLLASASICLQTARSGDWAWACWLLHRRSACCHLPS